MAVRIYVDTAFGDDYFFENDFVKLSIGQLLDLFSRYLQRQIIITFTAVPVTMFTIPVNDPTTHLLELNIAAKRTNGLGRAGFIRRLVVYRDGGGLAIEGGITTPLTRRSGTAGAYDVTFTPSGNDLLVIVTGDAGHDVEWNGTVTRSNTE